jgi:hypothetical protein
MTPQKQHLLMRCPVSALWRCLQSLHLVAWLLCLQGERWHADGVRRGGDCSHLEGKLQPNMHCSIQHSTAL